eukprot:m.305497 g.305497  ORF g.305497 m.305497 type:complete len:57 (+) comp27343_c0_seq1:284-454(+)
MDRLMAHINANSSFYRMRLQWSTPGTYMDAIHSKNVSWPIKVCMPTCDFFHTFNNA